MFSFNERTAELLDAAREARDTFEVDTIRLRSELATITEDRDELNCRVCDAESNTEKADDLRRDLELELQLLKRRSTPRSIEAGDAPDHGYIVLAFMRDVWQLAAYLDDGEFNWWMPCPPRPEGPKLTEVEKLQAENDELRKILRCQTT